MLEDFFTKLKCATPKLNAVGELKRSPFYGIPMENFMSIFFSSLYFIYIHPSCISIDLEGGVSTIGVTRGGF
jgi:hypothetical protein